jgi:hypothetical protein
LHHLQLTGIVHTSHFNILLFQQLKGNRPDAATGTIDQHLEAISQLDDAM